MVRKQVYITPQQQEKLTRLARQAGKTEAEFIRDAIAREGPLAAWREIEATIDRRARLLRANTGRKWRREDLYDRGKTSTMSRRLRSSSSAIDSAGVGGGWHSRHKYPGALGILQCVILQRNHAAVAPPAGH
jgi:hypothetical protein